MTLKPVSFAPGYFVTETGELWSELLGEARRLRLNPTTNGYLGTILVISGRKRRFNIHRLLALVFLGNPPSPSHQVRHLDGNKTNNHISNLAWGTPQENTSDSIRHGVFPRGESHANARLTACGVADIKRRLARGEGQDAIARDYGVSQVAISLIKRGKTWKTT